LVIAANNGFAFAKPAAGGKRETAPKTAGRRWSRNHHRSTAPTVDPGKMPEFARFNGFVFALSHSLHIL
jgi:hypothetical protein